MKKIFILFMMLAISFASLNCGGGSGGSSSPGGEKPGVPEIVQVLPSHYIAQTNSTILINVKVLNGNGTPIRNIPVTFTNLSPIGVLLSDNDIPLNNKTVVKTNDIGIATVKIKSTVEGFATIQAEVNKGVAIVRDRKTVFFSFSGQPAQPAQLEYKLTLEVSGNGDPYTLFESGIINDNEVNVTATVSFGAFLVSGSVVTFGADRPYKVGSSATCSDGSDTCDVIFPFGNKPITNDSGEASVFVRVVPTSLTSLETTLNIYAQSDTGAFNMVTLFLEPVKIDTVKVFANPQSVASKGTSDISAQVTTTAGTPTTDGTTVNFTTNKGGIDPFAQTTNGIAKAKYTAPEITSDTTATITASVGGKSGTVLVGVTAPVIPPPPDTTSPTVSSTIPANGATGVAHPTTVTINFSENINCSTVTTTTVTITPSATWTLTSCSGNKVVFNGTTTAANTLYTVNVGTGVKDLAGNVAVASVFSFMTGP